MVRRKVRSTPASAAFRATWASRAAAPAVTRPPSTAMALKPRPRRTTTPAMPPSRTMRFEPTPTGSTGTSRRQRPEKGGEVGLVGRLEEHLRRPPDPEPGDLGHRSRPRQRPAHRRQGQLTRVQVVLLAPLCRSRRPGRKCLRLLHPGNAGGLRRLDELPIEGRESRRSPTTARGAGHRQNPCRLRRGRAPRRLHRRRRPSPSAGRRTRRSASARVSALGSRIELRSTHSVSRTTVTGTKTGPPLIRARARGDCSGSSRVR